MRNDDTRDWPIREDIAFQARVWTAQRAAWIGFVLIPLLALSGVFAHGVLSERTAGGVPPMSVDYEAFQRVTDLTRFVIHVAPAGSSELRLGAPFQQTYEIESLTPQPARSTAGDDGLRMTFDHPGGPLSVVIWARPRRFGRLAFSADSGGTPLTLNILVYP
jgi:hypothetical protein